MKPTSKIDMNNPVSMAQEIAVLRRERQQLVEALRDLVLIGEGSDGLGNEDAAYVKTGRALLRSLGEE